MRKYLLIIILLAWSGVDYLYAQATGEVEFDKLRFCESGDVTMTITFTGDAPYDFKYWIDNGIVDQGVQVTAHNSNTFKLVTNFTESGYIRVYDFKDTHGNDGTFNQDRGDITIDKMPSPLIDPTFKTCRIEGTFTANPGGEYTSANWLEVAGGSFLTKTDTKAIFKADVVGNYVITYEVTNESCVNTDTKTFYIPEQAEPNASYDLLDDRICSDETTSLEIVGDGANRYPLTLGFSDDKGNTYSEVLNTANESIPISANSSTTYTMNSLIDSEGCDASLAETLNLIVDSKPFPTAGVKDSPNCGSEKELLGQITDGNSMTWSVVAAEGSGLFIEDVNNKDSRVYVNYNYQYAYETYTLKLTELVINNPTCIGEDEVEIELYKEPGDVSLGQDTTVYNEKQLIINTVGIADMPFYWTLSDGLSVDDGNPNQIVVRNLLKGDNKLICTVNNGECAEVSAEKLITVKGIYQTNGFSPNGDNTNDYFIIGGAQNVANNKLTVFDITGKVVFEANEFMVENNLDGWNGQKNDGKTEDGTYYYIFEGDNIEPVKSYLIIKGSKQ
ncbi:gliding motility-associated C-terminal domain-containing protein [Carboxylicivirga sp. A043]|uniref:gliding motility-associated C-terminal domain-containing protein n=1 Tax=Carboxylicivirga litoralis TaxID=2816963 RepID=UPI0021CB77B1|nr:gliding motility-associated C-terminal domain-containing protein [Carboxylicivirga sp. A043]MCU4154865.1 gliding motility-associated C-terminal domain-containing protein [Carboxylicivirga sp. A043]